MAEADPRTMFNIHDAKTNLSKLVERVQAGEEIVLAKAGKPCARIVAYTEPERPCRQPGRLAHLRQNVPSDIWFEPAFTAAELDAFESGPLARD